MPSMVGADKRRLARLIVSTVSLRNFRSYARLELALDPGLVLLTGPNGAGKTNLLESLHVGTQGFSPQLAPMDNCCASANTPAGLH